MAYGGTGSGSGSGGTSIYDNQVFFPKTGDGRYQADIMVSDANGGMQHFNILPDSGADLILLTQADGQRLGYDLNTIRDNLGVEGIHKGTPGNFKVVPCWVMIGTLPPVKAPVGIATDDNALETSLLGDRGTLDAGFSAEYNQHGVTYRKLVSGAYSGRAISF